ncbi:hypothetical protein Tco_0913871 [Tanacetum coccineum]
MTAVMRGRLWWIMQLTGEPAGYQVTLSARESKVTSLEVDKARLEAVEASVRGAYEQVAAMKEPFHLSKVKGYRSSYQKEHTQASNVFATAMFPWLDKFIADATTPIEALLSKNPPILQKPAPSRTLMPAPSSQKATPSSASSVNPISPFVNLLNPSPTLLE